jgi:hypothetical protein
MNMQDVTVTIDEGQRQMLLLALAKLSIERPGWHWTLGELASKYSIAPQFDDGRHIFEQFRELHAHDRHAAIGDHTRQAIVTIDPACAEGCPVHVRYINEAGETWDHGYAELEDLDLRREIGEWLTGKRSYAPFADMPDSPKRDRMLERWANQARGRPRDEG